jgi:hypothetical protein
MSWWLNGHFGASPAAARTLNALVCGIGILSIACEAEKCILTSSSCFVYSAESCGKLSGCSWQPACTWVSCESAGGAYRKESECSDQPWCGWDEQRRFCVENPDAGPIPNCEGSDAGVCSQLTPRCAWIPVCANKMTELGCEAIDSETQCRATGACLWTKESPLN